METLSFRVKDVPLSRSQQSLLHSLERSVELHLQSATSGALSTTEYDKKSPSRQQYLSSYRHVPKEEDQDTYNAHASLRDFSIRIDKSYEEWESVYKLARESQKLVDEMEESHTHVVTRTRALYDGLESILNEVQQLERQMEVIEEPLPLFTAIESVAPILGFAVKLEESGNQNKDKKPVEVFQHQRSVDPTTKDFEKALRKIDDCIDRLHEKLHLKDTASYIQAYHALAAGALHTLKDYAISALDAAKDNVRDRIPSDVQHTQPMDETTPYYVHFQLASPALKAVSKQLNRLQRQHPSDSYHGLKVLSQVGRAYADQRAALLYDPLNGYFGSIADTSDVVNLVRVGGAHLIAVCEAEFRLFESLFDKHPMDEGFRILVTDADANEPESDEDDSSQELAFDRLAMQLSYVFYHVARPLVLKERDVVVLCELLQVLQTELMGGDRHNERTVGPVLNRLQQDTIEKLIWNTQRSFEHEVEYFTPTGEDLNYPVKLSTDDAYATWYPTLEKTLFTLSHVYHFLPREVFEELAQEGIRVCCESLDYAAREIESRQGPMHGCLFLLFHQLTLREQLAPFHLQVSSNSSQLIVTNEHEDLSAPDSISAFLVRFFFPPSDDSSSGSTGSASDPSKNVEVQLKRSCNRFVQLAAGKLGPEVLSVNVKAIESQNGDTKVLQQVEESVLKLSKRLDDCEAKTLQETLHQYLRNSAAEAILFKPVQKKLMEAIVHLETAVQSNYSSDVAHSCLAVLERATEQLQTL